MKYVYSSLDKIERKNIKNRYSSKRGKRNKRILYLLAVNISIILLISLIFNLSKIYAGQEPKYIEKVVSSGDTLWEYASEISEKTNYDIKVTNIIMDIQEMNNMSSSDIIESETIRLPIYD